MSHRIDKRADLRLVEQVEFSNLEREKRTDWLMRQYVDHIQEQLKNGMDKMEAKRLLEQRGVPVSVQYKVLRNSKGLIY